jgi:D-serine dehydratase
MMDKLVKNYPIIEQMLNGEVFWLNPNADGKLSTQVTKEDIQDAYARLLRFAPYIEKAFPETKDAHGIIESPLVGIPEMAEFLSVAEKFTKTGKLFLKCDNLLPVSGSIKARGGIYEVLCLAERLARENGLLKDNDNYSVFDSKKARELFSHYSIAVGSTGNLGLSIGIMSAKLGFNVTVHMSADAKQWKKDLLRQKGAVVIEYAGDYQKAVTEGRKLAEKDPMCHFVDDENSMELFLGYATAAQRLKRQLMDLHITVCDKRPMFVYLPCGVGGGPGGVAYGLKQIYGENVHCFFAEPIQAPCMLLGVMTGLHDKISTLDIGLTGKTIADGLAVSRPSTFVGKVVGNLLDGIYTVSDERLTRLVKELYETEGIFVEPSAASGLHGYTGVMENAEYLKRFDDESITNAVHIVWATGGGMVPKDERDKFIK